MSFPHFYQADEKFISAIDGMHPNKEDHETFVDINPVSTYFFLVRAEVLFCFYVMFITAFLRNILSSLHRCIQVREE
jgi:hypothetical protein